MNRAEIYLKRGKEESLKRKHPWIFSGAIERAEVEEQLTEGEVVDVFAKGGEYLASGHYQVGSIAVRVLTFEREVIDQEWWNKRIKTAYELRQSLQLTDSEETTCYRLIHGEGDMLPGLVIDIYDTHAVVQCHSVGMYMSRSEIAEALKSLYGDKLTSIYDKRRRHSPTTPI